MSALLWCAGPEFGDQRIYASHHSIMFSRHACYFFVRPKTKFLEVCVFLERTLNAPQVRTVSATSKTRVAHLLRITHRDEVEPPITDWLKEAYDANDPGTRRRRSQKTATRSTRVRSRRSSAKSATARTRGKKVAAKPSSPKRRSRS